MKKLFLLLLLCHVSSAVKHSLRFFLTGHTGIPNLPELVIVAQVDEILAGYCDSKNQTIEPKQDWVKELLDKDTEQLDFYKQQCFHRDPKFRKDMIENFLQPFSHSEGVHVYQEMSGCDWDNETGEVKGYMAYHYDGEEFLSFDAKTKTWTPTKPQVKTKTMIWNNDTSRAERNRIYLTETLVNWLKKHLDFGNSSLLRKELPSVSLLQKTPSSPVTCHATGFYPKNASLFWRKDGKKINETVDHGEILPNDDGTFQMRVDLNISSVTPADWRKYECVFQFPGLSLNDNVTKLDKAVIRTNWEDPNNNTGRTHVILVFPFLVLVAVIGFILYRKKKDKHPPPSPDSSSQTSDGSKSETPLINSH